MSNCSYKTSKYFNDTEKVFFPFMFWDHVKFDRLSEKLILPSSWVKHRHNSWITVFITFIFWIKAFFLPYKEKYRKGSSQPRCCFAIVVDSKLCTIRESFDYLTAGFAFELCLVTPHLRFLAVFPFIRIRTAWNQKFLSKKNQWFSNVVYVV